jgi:hypothetical protein
MKLFLSFCLLPLFCVGQSDTLTTPYNIQLLAMSVHDCQDPNFPLIEKAYLNLGKLDAVSKAVIRSYQLSIDACISKAAATADTNLLNWALSIVSRNPRDLTPEITEMNLRLDFYRQQEGHEDQYYHWIQYYMNRKLTTTVTDLTEGVNRAYDKLYGSQAKPEEGRDTFIKRWVKGDLESLSSDLNHFASFYLKTFADPTKLRLALEWSTRASKLLPLPQHWQTNALLHHKLGQRTEAISQAQKAIEAAEKLQEDKKPYEELLNTLLLK